MPLRSPKMYSFIFGFHRFVWCPKWTPASKRSFIATAKKSPPLSLAELEPFARAGHAVLLAFFRAGISREQSTLLQGLPQLRVVRDERAGDSQAHRAGLSVDAAAGHSGDHIELL